MRSWPNLMYGDIYNYLITSKAVDGEEMKNLKSLMVDASVALQSWKIIPRGDN
jgi:hypothetical protein